MGTSKILTTIIPTSYSPNIIGTTYGIEPAYSQHIGMMDRRIKRRVIQRRNKIKNIWKIDGIV